MAPPPYHHGDLPHALREAAAALITEQGAAGFSLREVARRAGVSHAAPAHHFGDARGLLTALGVEAFQRLYENMEASVAGVDEPTERLVRVGTAYVVTGRDFPAHCAVVFRGDLVDTLDPQYEEWGLRTYGFLEDAVRAVAEHHNPSLDIDDASRLCWAAMQGLLELHAPMSEIARKLGRPEVDLVEQAEAATRLMLSGLLQAP
jgi:AcrR family transcriptional regulator